MANAPFMYWNGQNTPADLSAEDLRRWNDFYGAVHIPEFLEQNPGIIRATRYELLIPDPRGDRGPRWLSIAEMESEEAAKGYLARAEGPVEARPRYTPGAQVGRPVNVWKMIWRRHAPRDGEIGAHGAPYLWVTGTDLPRESNEADMAARYSLYREMLHPEPGCPRHLAVYEADQPALEALAERRREDPALETGLPKGPPIREAHTTTWRLVYRRLATYTRRTR